MIKSFTDLKAWQKSHELALEIYKLTGLLPEKERFGITSQIQRAAVSIPSNIAEGFGRVAVKDKEHFFVIASGSLYELKSQLILVRDLGYIDKKQFVRIADLANNTHKVINGLLRAHRGSNV